MVEAALRSVVREALAQTAAHGLPGAHHFYITFRTDLVGVTIPEFLRTQYPHEMTIVLEHQFWGLEVEGDTFSVTLSFHGQPQRLTVPLVAITAFADPSAKFGLEFRADMDMAAASPPAPPTALKPASAKAPLLERASTDRAPTKVPLATRLSGEAGGEPAEAKAGDKAADKPGEVVKLDHFRKK